MVVITPGLLEWDRHLPWQPRHLSPKRHQSTTAFYLKIIRTSTISSSLLQSIWNFSWARGFLWFGLLEIFKKRISATLRGCSQYPLDGLLGGEVGPPWYEIGKDLGREFPWRQPPLPTGGTLDREPVMHHSNNSAIHSTFFKDKTLHKKTTKPA